MKHALTLMLMAALSSTAHGQQLKLKLVYEGHQHTIHGVNFSPDGSKVVSHAGFNDVRVWKTDNGEQVDFCNWNEAFVRSALMFDDNRVISGGGQQGQQGEAKIWGLNLNKVDRAIRPRDGIFHIAHCRRRNMLAMPCYDGKLRFFCLRKNDFLPKAEIDAMSAVAAFHPNGNELAVMDFDGKEFYKLRVWRGCGTEVETGIEMRPKHVSRMCYSPDGKRIACAMNRSTVWIFNAETWEIEGAVHTKSFAACFSGDSKCLITADDEKGEIVFWDVATREVVSRTPAVNFVELNTPIVNPQGQVGKRLPMIFALTVSPDGSLLASGANDFDVRLWKIK